MSAADSSDPRAARSSASTSAANAFALLDQATIVTGLPRSGTSLLMQILEAAGLPLARDDARPPDPDNPRGYHELAAVKRLRSDAGFLADCRGRVVKIVAPLVMALPRAAVGRVLFARRDLDEVLASQRAMLARQGEALAPGDEAPLRRAFASSLEQTRAWLAGPDAPPVLFVDHRRLIDAPHESADQIARFLEETARPVPSASNGDASERDRRLRAMAAAIDPTLHRQRGVGGGIEGGIVAGRGPARPAQRT